MPPSGRCGQSLPAETALIGFAGAPWTLAAYMVEGGSSADFSTARAFALARPDAFARLIELLSEAVCEHLAAQIDAGAEVVQLFDSWAGVLPEPEFVRWCTAPAAHIAGTLKARHPEVPIIAFPRGAGVMYQRFAMTVPVDAISLDSSVPLAWAREAMPGVCLQGNLDPAALVAGGEVACREARRIVETLGERAVRVQPGTRRAAADRSRCRGRAGRVREIGPGAAERSPVTDPILWLKALHIMAFAAWMAGLWYLPRLFVYHSQVAAGSEASEKYKIMERRLLRGIATPAMIAALGFGIALATLEEQWSAGWLHAKTALVVLLALSQGVMAWFVTAICGGSAAGERTELSLVQRGADAAVHRHRDLGRVPARPMIVSGRLRWRVVRFGFDRPELIG